MQLVAPEATIFWLTLIFIILMFLLKKYAWKPILKAIHDRENTINEALDIAKKTQEEIKFLQEQNQQSKIQAMKDRELILKEANLMKDQLLKEAKEEAHKSATIILENAHQQIEHNKQQLLKDIKIIVAETTLIVTEKILAQKLSEDALYQKIFSQELSNFKF